MKIELSSYAKRLQEWNSNKKYQSEILFLERLLNLEENERVFDYGCGIGSCVEYFTNKYKSIVTGFDVNLFDEIVNKDWFETELKGPYNKVYFMHSLAHIPGLNTILSELKNHLSKENLVVVITPNKDFDDYYKRIKSNNKYNPDATVIKHFTTLSLSELFETNGFSVIANGQFGKFENGHFERLFLLASLIN